MAADSTMFRMVKRLMALSLGVHREQLLQRMGLTWPRPFLLRPLECDSQHLGLRRGRAGVSAGTRLEAGQYGLVLSLLDHDFGICRESS